MNPLTLTLCCCQPCALILIPSLFCLEPNGKHHNPTLTNLPNCLGSISFFLTCPTHPQFSSVAQSCPTLCDPVKRTERRSSKPSSGGLGASCMKGFHMPGTEMNSSCALPRSLSPTWEGSKEACFVKPSLLSLAGDGRPGSPRRHRSHLPNLNTLALPQLATVLAAPGLQDYFLRCVAPVAAPHLTPFSAWALRHEYHLQYLTLTLAQRAVGAPNLPPPMNPILPPWNMCCF